MDIKREALRLYNETEGIREEFNSILRLLDYPEVYLDTKYSKYLLTSKAKLEKIVKTSEDVKTILDLGSDGLEDAVKELQKELVKLGADSILSCVVELIGNQDCVSIIKKEIQSIADTNKFEMDSNLEIKGFGAYAYLSNYVGKHTFKGNPKGEVLVYVYPKEEIPKFKLEDVEIDYFHSDGAGGQNVNKVETGIRATHIPTNIVVTCRDERSQIMNKNRALERLEEQVKDYYLKTEKKKIDEIKKEQKNKGEVCKYIDGAKV